MRLLRCLECRSIEELPDPPKGVDPHNISPGEDPLLDELISRHVTETRPHQGQLFAVPDADWKNDDARSQILEQIIKSDKETGLGAEYYDVRNTFQEDALKCFAEHNRPERCIDWKSNRKALGRATPEGKAWQKQNYKAPQTFLCDFCPVASQVQLRKQDAGVE